MDMVVVVVSWREKGDVSGGGSLVESERM